MGEKPDLSGGDMGMDVWFFFDFAAHRLQDWIETMSSKPFDTTNCAMQSTVTFLWAQQQVVRLGGIQRALQCVDSRHDADSRFVEPI